MVRTQESVTRRAEGRRYRVTLLLGTLVPAVLYCWLLRDYDAVWDVAYDVPASLAVFSFLARLVVQGWTGPRSRRWRASFGAVFATLGIAALSRILQGWVISWHVSGHVTMTLLTALVLSAETRFPPWLRVLYWVPVPVVAAVRVFYLHDGIELGLITGLLIGGPAGAVVVLTTPAEPCGCEPE